MAIEDLINQNIEVAGIFRDAAADAIGNITTPGGQIGYTTLNLGNLSFDANYTAVEQDTTPLPIYHEPTLTQPNAPVLSALTGINSPQLPVAPAVNTRGLFQQTRPSANLPQFTAEPVLHGNEIYRALIAVGQPVLEKVVLPTITPLVIKDAPNVNLPGYTPYAPNGELAASADYQRDYKAQYSEYLPKTRSFVEDVMAGLMNQYAPDYDDLRDKLAQAVSAGMSGQGLPKPYDDALYSRQQARIRREMVKAEQALVNDPGYRGWIVPPGAVQSGVGNLHVDAAITLAGASTDASIEIRRQALQAYQFVLTMADGQLNSLRGFIAQFADKALGMISAAQQQAKTLSELLINRFEHERSRHEFSLQLMKALDEQFKIKMEAALSGLKAYEVELEALKLRSDIDQQQLDRAKLQVEIQKEQVNTYSAIIDAIAKRAVGDDIKIKQFELQAKAFDIETKAVLAGYDVFKASIDGDRGKLEGELSKTTVYKNQLEGVRLQLEAEKAVQTGIIQHNEAQLTKYTAGLSAYETAAKIALQRFTSDAELKKLGLETYQTNAQVNLELYRTQAQQDQAHVNATIQAFHGNVSSLNNYYQLRKEYAHLNLNAQTSIATGYSNIASAATQANNAMLSLAQSA